MSSRAALARLFVAVYPPPITAGRLLELVRAREWRSSDLAPTPIDQVHLTLLFIGDTPARDVPEMVESLERACAGMTPFELRPIALATLPVQGPPRLIAAIADAPPGLIELQRRLAIRLARNVKVRSRAGQGEAGFVPHLTLARFSGVAAPSGFEERIEAEAFMVSRVRLMRSILRPTGAIHAEVAAIELRRR